MKTILAIAMGALLIAAAPVKLAPADDKPAQLVGAAARARNGPDPMAKPPEDVGSTEDPVSPLAPLAADRTVKPAPQPAGSPH